MNNLIRCFIIFSLNISLNIMAQNTNHLAQEESSVLETIRELCIENPTTTRICIDLALLGIGLQLGGGRVIRDIIRTPNDEELLKILQHYPKSAGYGALLVGSTCVSLFLEAGRGCHRLLERFTNIEGIDDDEHPGDEY